MLKKKDTESFDPSELKGAVVKYRESLKEPDGVECIKTVLKFGLDCCDSNDIAGMVRSILVSHVTH